MNFEIDNHTRKDLELFDEGKSSNSIYSFFNHTQTRGGKALLYELMKHPTCDMQQLTDRRDSIRFFQESNIDFTINYHQIDFIEHYLNLSSPVLKNNVVDAFYQHISAQLQPNNTYYIIQTGIRHFIQIFRYLYQVITSTDRKGIPVYLNNLFEHIEQFLRQPDINKLMASGEKISFSQVSTYDHLLRKKYRKQLYTLLDLIYLFDVFDTIASRAATKEMAYPEYVHSAQPKISIKGLFHPLLENAVTNDVQIDETKNLIFLTGPNMAGKSTFLKSIGLSVYLAHIGFPVPARYMQTTLYHGLITTINLADNRLLGYSHFYSEVKRVKETALVIKEQKNVFVIFDELFRGTNVKDAFDASLLIISAFAKIKSCSFLVSTHITEVARELAATKNIRFNYFDSALIHDKPVYNYKLHEGVSEERMGILIVRNEKITEILESIQQE